MKERLLKQHTLLAETLKDSDNFNITLGHEVTMFCDELTSEIRGIKTFPKSTTEAWVYREGDLMVMGYIGYGDYQTNRAGDKKYCVFSHKNANGKYSHGSDAYYMTLSKSIPLAVKKAKTSLRPYTVDEMALACVRFVKSKCTLAASNADYAVRAAKEAVGLEKYGRSADPLVRELTRLVTTGYVFAESVVHDKAIELVDALKLAEETKSNDDGVCLDFIRVQERIGDMTMYRSRIEDASHSAPHVIHPHETDNAYNSTPKRLEDVDEEIQRRLAGLSMCQPHDFVQDVGYKIDDQTFFIYPVD